MRPASVSDTFTPMNYEQILERLKSNYPNSEIEVVDLTGTSDHWEVSIVSEQFQGLMRVQQHQHVMTCFAPELKTGEVHALSIKTKIKSS